MKTNDRSATKIGGQMFSRYDADRVVRRWIRRVAVTVLIVMVTSIVWVAGLAVWVVSETVPVVVVDEHGRPVSGAVVFDMTEAVKQSGVVGLPHGQQPIGPGGFGCGTCLLSVPVAPQPYPVTAPSIRSGQALGAGTTWGALSIVVNSRSTRPPTPPVSPTKARVRGWLHRVVQPFGAALVWDWDRPVYTGGAGEARVPESDELTVMSPGDLRYEPGQVFAVEQSSQGTKGVGQPARFVLRAVQTRPAALEKRVYWSCNDTLLSDFVKLVESEIGRPVQVDKPQIEEEGIALDTPIRVQVRDLPLRSALKVALGQFNLTFVWENQSIRITSKLQADNELETRLYPVRDLLPGDGNELRQYADELQEMIEQTVYPNCWSSVGGPGEIAVFERERTMFVQQPQWLHEFIEARLVSLRAGKNPPFSADEQQIQQALARPVSFDIEKMPLETACEFLSALGGVSNIVLDRPALEEEGITPLTPVTFRVQELPFGLALHEMLNLWNLTAIVKDGVVQVTSKLSADNELEHRVYPVADLIDDPSDPDSLIEILENSVEVNSWSCVGGAGSMVYFTPRRLLVVNQTPAVHSQIELLLTALRSGEGIVATEADRRVRQALASPVTADFHGLPFEDALDRLATQAGIKNVFIDHAGLAEEAVRPRAPVNLIVRDMPLRCALRSMLRPLGLAAIVQNGSLYVTTEREADNHLQVGIYAARDLLGKSPDADWLIEMIEQAVLPTSWSSVGGAGTIQFFAARDYVVIRATDFVHDDVAALLARLRGKPLPGSAREDAIRQGLHLLSGWRLEQVPLSTLATRLSEALACTVTIRNRKDVGSETIVSVLGDSDPLDLALARGLAAIGARYVVRDESILITGRDDEPITFVARTYPAAAFIVFDDDADDLLARLEESVDPESWSFTGGNGTVSYAPTTGQLVVYRDEPHHLLVKQFLANLAAGSDNRVR